MYWEKVIRIYAAVNGCEAAEIEKDVLDGWISKEMLLEAYLEDEGIFGYTSTILAIIEEIDERTM